MAEPEDGPFGKCTDVQVVEKALNGIAADKNKVDVKFLELSVEI